MVYVLKEINALIVISLKISLVNITSPWVIVITKNAGKPFIFNNIIKYNL